MQETPAWQKPGLACGDFCIHVRNSGISARYRPWSRDSRGNLPAQLADRGLTPDIVVNNAGFTTMGPVQRADRSAELALIRTNVEAVVDLCPRFEYGTVLPRVTSASPHAVFRF